MSTAWVAQGCQLRFFNPETVVEAGTPPHVEYVETARLVSGESSPVVLTIQGGFSALSTDAAATILKLGATAQGAKLRERRRKTRNARVSTILPRLLAYGGTADIPGGRLICPVGYIDFCKQFLMTVNGVAGTPVKGYGCTLNIVPSLGCWGTTQMWRGGPYTCYNKPVWTPETASGITYGPALDYDQLFQPINGSLVTDTSADNPDTWLAPKNIGFMQVYGKGAVLFWEGSTRTAKGGNYAVDTYVPAGGLTVGSELGTVAYPQCYYDNLPQTTGALTCTVYASASNKSGPQAFPPAVVVATLPQEDRYSCAFTYMHVDGNCIKRRDYDNIFALEMVLYHAINKLAWRLLRGGESPYVYSDYPEGVWPQYQALLARWNLLVASLSYISYITSVRESLTIQLGWCNPVCSPGGFLAYSTVTPVSIRNNELAKEMIFYPGTTTTSAKQLARDNNQYIEGDPILFIIHSGKIYCGSAGMQGMRKLSASLTAHAVSDVSISGLELISDIQDFAGSAVGPWVLGVLCTYPGVGGMGYVTQGFKLAKVTQPSTSFIASPDYLDSYSVTTTWYDSHSADESFGPVHKPLAQNVFNVYSLKEV